MYKLFTINDIDTILYRVTGDGISLTTTDLAFIFGDVGFIHDILRNRL